MQDLTPVGLSKDGKRLLLVSSKGEEFAVPVDTRLRAALRGDNARLGQLEKKMDSALRPRDIRDSTLMIGRARSAFYAFVTITIVSLLALMGSTTRWIGLA